MQKNNSGQTQQGVPTENFERQNYYFGKLLKKQDFEAEQSYLNEKRWLLNRLCHGWGVVCGLKVVPCPGEAGKIIVLPGMALDNHGNEIVVAEPQKVDLVEACEAACKKNKYYVTIKYFECQTQPSPIPVEDCGEYKTDCVYERTREYFKIEVTCDEPGKANSVTNCDENPLPECVQILHNPAHFVIEGCSERVQCEPLALACVCYVEGCDITENDIDNLTYRRVAYNNEFLFEMICHLQEAHGRMHTSQLDRRQHVPLLATTMGVPFRDGKIDMIDDPNWKYPHRIASDGHYNWITDRESNTLIRIDKWQNQKAPHANLTITHRDTNISCNCWGIAYDGANMWVTHHDTDPGMVTCIDVCSMNTETYGSLILCDDIIDCEKRTPDDQQPTPVPLLARPQEIVLHRGDLYIAHALGVTPGNAGRKDAGQRQSQQEDEGTSQQNSQKFYISRIDPVKACCIEIIEVPVSDCAQVSEILNMVSDGTTLWLLYECTRDSGSSEGILRKIDLDANNKADVSDALEIDVKIRLVKDMVFDGTHLWISHKDGVLKYNIATGKPKTIDTTDKQIALVYCGGQYVFSAQIGSGESKLNWIEILSERFDDWFEIMEYHEQTNPEYQITDMQFDGNYICVAAYYKDADNPEPKGIIHRLLP